MSNPSAHEGTPDTSSSSRPAVEASTHFTCRPATRPDWLKNEVFDPRLLGLPDLLGRALMARLRAAHGTGWSSLSSDEARSILRDWASIDTGHALLALGPSVIKDLAQRHPDEAPHWNRWLAGEPEHPRHLITHCWCLGLHPRTIGAVERLIKRM